MNNGVGALVASPPSPSSMEWDMWVAAAKADDVDAIRRILERNPDILRKEEDVSGVSIIVLAIGNLSNLVEMSEIQLKQMFAVKNH